MRFRGARDLGWLGLMVLALGVLAAPAEARRVLTDIEYARVDSVSLRLDLYLPTNSPGPTPLVVWIHGGAWMSGSKEDCAAPDVLGDAYAVASIDYRLTQNAPFPAQLDDCKAAVRWLRAHAGDYGIDASRIGAWGESAGGHLAALLGTSGNVPELEGTVGDDLSTSSRVQAVCDFCGPTDLAAMVAQLLEIDPETPMYPFVLLFGGTPDEKAELARLASPVSHVDASDPPFLIVHGDQDDVVPYAQATSFYSALMSAGVDASLYTVGGAGHCAFPSAVRDVARAFFDRALGARTG